jgi:hypothetical protein
LSGVAHWPPPAEAAGIDMENGQILEFRYTKDGSASIPNDKASFEYI